MNNMSVGCGVCLLDVVCVCWMWCVSAVWRETFPAPSLYIVGKNVVLTAIHCNTAHGPWITAAWNVSSAVLGVDMRDETKLCGCVRCQIHYCPSVSHMACCNVHYGSQRFFSSDTWRVFCRCACCIQVWQLNFHWEQQFVLRAVTVCIESSNSLYWEQ
jgi:hypothetical protein